jgi:DNA (cytosine-5)-methyltransferase 1
LDILRSDSSLSDAAKDIDLIVGGPPCQGFCGINRYRTSNDPRNSLVEVFFSIIQSIKPKHFIMENVNGILSLDDGNSFKNLISSFQEIGYNVSYSVIQAGGFGVPQNRWRVFLFGSLSEFKKINPPAPLFSFPRMPIFDAGRSSAHAIWPLSRNANDLFNPIENITVKEAIGNLCAIQNGEGVKLFKSDLNQQSRYSKFLNPNSVEISDHECSRLGEISMSRVKALPPDSGASWIDLPYELQPENLKKLPDVRYKNRYGRLHWDGIFNTILHKPEPYWGRVLHPREDRLISVRESARAQSFNDEFCFSGSIAEKYLQVGNSVPPILGMFLGWQVRSAFGDKDIPELIENYGQSFKI